jgi:hypothetical protein
MDLGTGEDLKTLMNEWGRNGLNNGPTPLMLDGDDKKR